MKMNVNRNLARMLVDALTDEQPGTALSDFRDTLDKHLNRETQQQMSDEEWLAVLTACMDQEEALGQLGNRTEQQGKQLANLARAIPKIKDLRGRTRAS